MAILPGLLTHFFPNGFCLICQAPVNAESDPMEHYFQEHPVDLVQMLARTRPDRADYFAAYAMTFMTPPLVHFCPKCSFGCVDRLTVHLHYYQEHVAMTLIKEQFWRGGRCAFCGVSEVNMIQHLIGHHLDQLEAIKEEKPRRSLTVGHSVIWERFQNRVSETE
jgi:hypothetical protein